MNYPSPQQQQQQQQQQEEEEEEEEDDLARRCEWDFTLSAAISPAPPTEASDVIGAIDVDPTDRLLATGGMARKIRFYAINPELRREFFITAPAKLSSLRWRPNSPGALAAGDYDGVVTEYDAESRVPLAERDEHGGRRVWSVDYSERGTLAASGSDDGTAHLWDPRGGPAAVGVVRTGAPVCCVEFGRGEDGVHVGLGCADRRAYVYDARALSSGPVRVLAGHGRTVSYVRFEGRGRMVTSSTDGSHRRWDLSSGEELRAYRGHANARSFVGMSVWAKGGLIACGSESNEVFVYDLRWGEPIWARRFGEGEGFVSAVCWREVGDDECALVAGGSDGVLQVLAGRRKL